MFLVAAAFETIIAAASATAAVCSFLAYLYFMRRSEAHAARGRGARARRAPRRGDRRSPSAARDEQTPRARARDGPPEHGKGGPRACVPHAALLRQVAL